MLGLCCHYLVSDKKPGTYRNLLKQSTLQVGRWKRGEYDKNKVKQVWHNNLRQLDNNLEFIFNRYQNFRFPSGILPLWDLVPQDWYENDQYIWDIFSSIGNKIITNNIRATFHPGQFCSLSSDNPNIVASSIREINHHAWQFDLMGLPISPYYAINVHGGKRGKQDQLIAVINGKYNDCNTYLHESARGRLTLENDELCYSTPELLRIYKSTGIPVVWDSHHHTLNNGGIFDPKLAYDACNYTWGSIKPLQHISNSKPGITINDTIQKRRAHSDYIYNILDCQLSGMRDNSIDIDVESKSKNLAIEKIINDYNLKDYNGKI
jgi:UV DNA damage endonuclease